MKCVILVFLSMLTSCIERHTVKEADLYQRPEALPFIQDHKDWEGEHFLDEGWLHFSYTPTEKAKVMVVLDSIALAEGWQIEMPSIRERVYLKEIRSYPADTGLDSLMVRYDSSRQRLNFELH